jgi:hypothetical protein
MIFLPIDFRKALGVLCSAVLFLWLFNVKQLIPWIESNWGPQPIAKWLDEPSVYAGLLAVMIAAYVQVVWKWLPQNRPFVYNDRYSFVTNPVDHSLAQFVSQGTAVIEQTALGMTLRAESTLTAMIHSAFMTLDRNGQGCILCEGLTKEGVRIRVVGSYWTKYLNNDPTQGPDEIYFDYREFHGVDTVGVSLRTVYKRIGPAVASVAADARLA